MVSITVGAIAAVGTVASSAMSSSAASSAAASSANASKNAAQLQYQSDQEARAQQQQNLDTTRANLQPYLGAGNTAENVLSDGLGLVPGGSGSLLNSYGASAPTESSFVSGYKPLDPSTLPTWDPSKLDQTPGYQFSLQQGLAATQNGFAAKGLGSSGAALMGASNYAQGLASTTYQQQFANYEQQYNNVLQKQGVYQQDYSNAAGQFNNNYNQYLASGNQYYANQQQRYNMIGGVAGSGQNAASGLGALSLNSTNAQSALTQASGQALAGGLVGASNANNAGIAGQTNATVGGLNALGGLAQQYGAQYQTNQMMNNGGLGWDAPVASEAAAGV